MPDIGVARRTVLHVGCGAADIGRLPAEFFPMEAWRELRLDIDPAARPDIIASITDMAAVESGSVDGVFSAHNLEHLFAHEVPLALAEFRRVLRPGGFALVTVPDLQRVAGLVAADRLDEPAYVSPAGPIAPLDMIFGHRGAIAQGNLFMAHRTGFTARMLEQALRAAGFPLVRVVRDERFALWGAAYTATG
ncbi:class I SAM-dependent methyltransferase [Paracraurococcus lichenis]|uniref:Methyltransferase domain-containing protein n=1 Tax=Paracraurococcus lichenis TaxID=3064888 RepID=A0ABT9E1T7_9PROT|nr:methyltransferase domain-containing protein [Paracraurococcus sp. LOR1-02]MDO9710124.1 methyltransferase domain-containing protein [Paracraurococcus sp. LOR1-02]